jgi:hypothetical protein
MIGHYFTLLLSDPPEPAQLFPLASGAEAYALAAISEAYALGGLTETYPLG